MKNKNILGMPIIAFYSVCSVLILGIIIGSFCDFQISNLLSNKTGIGDFFQHYANVLSNSLYPVAGMCIFKGLKKKGKSFDLLSWVILILSIFYSVICNITVSGKYLRETYGYVSGQPGSFFRIILCLLTWVAIASLFAFLASKIIDDKKSNQLIVVGSVILVAGIFSIELNEWLKVIGNRPRYKYLITLEEPISEFRNWWQMRPYFSSDNSFQSWPSGHMTYATIMMCLPMIASVLKYKKEWLKNALFTFAVIWVILFGYNRIHMNAHFLTDVCFGVLITYCLYALIYLCAFAAFPDDENKIIGLFKIFKR